MNVPAVSNQNLHVSNNNSFSIWKAVSISTGAASIVAAVALAFFLNPLFSLGIVLAGLVQFIVYDVCTKQDISISSLKKSYETALNRLTTQHEITVIDFGQQLEAKDIAHLTALRESERRYEQAQRDNVQLIAVQKEDLARSRGEIHNLSRLNLQLNTNSSSMKSNVVSDDDKLKLKQRADELAQQLQEITKDLEAERTKSNNNARKYLRQEETLKGLRESLQTADQTNKKIKEDNEILNNRIQELQNLETELHSLRKAILEQTSTMASLTQQKDNIEQKLQQTTEVLTAETEAKVEFEKAKTQLEGQLSESRQAYAISKKQLEDAGKIIERSKETTEKQQELIGKLQQSNEKNGQLLKEKAELVTANAELMSKNSALLYENAALKSKLGSGEK